MSKKWLYWEKDLAMEGLVLHRKAPGGSLLQKIAQGWVALLRFIWIKFSISKRASSISSIKAVIMLNIFSTKNPYIIIADDDDDDRSLFKEAVDELHAPVKLVCAENGEKLMDMLTSPGARLPDLIFLDLNMPIKNGFECLEEIRRNEKLNRIPIIIYSTSSHPDQIEKTFTSGANLYLRKPDSFSELKKATEKIFSLEWDKVPVPTRDNFLLKTKH